MPQRFGRFWLQEKIGHGGMAEIFRATIGPDERTYAFELAIKRMHAELETDPKHVGMFLTEADVAKLLRHPNLVQVYEAGIIEGHVYIAMEYVWGFDLARLIEQLRRRRLRLSPELAVYIALQVLRGLDYVHQAKSPRGEAMDIVHRDVTPSNIYVTFKGEVKLGDFGIARVKRAGIPAEEETELKGKVHYMPPEVIKGEEITQSLDLWSLSVTLYEMLTARGMYEDVAAEDMMAGKYSTRIEPVHKINPAAEGSLSKLLQACLDPKKKRRPQDATTLYRELKRCLAEMGQPADAAILGKFVRAGTGLAANVVEPNSQHTSGEFDKPGYQAPIEFSPTQRYEIRRRASIWKPVMMGAPIAAGLVAAMGAGYYMARRGASPQGAEAVMSLSPGSKAGAPVATASPEDAAAKPDPTAAPAHIPAPMPVPQLVVPAPGGDSDAGMGDLEAGLVDDMSSKGGAQNFKPLVQKGTVALKKHDLGTAVDAFRQALAMRADSTLARIGLARALLEQSDFPEAEKVAQAAVSQDPSNARAQFLLGSILKASGQPVRARKAFQACLDAEPHGALAPKAQQVLKGLPQSP